MKKLEIVAGQHHVALEPEKIMANNVILPWEFNPHNVRLWVIGHEFGAIGAVWADNEQDALDELVDHGLGECLLVQDPKLTEEDNDQYTPLGNAGELADLTYVWTAPVIFDFSRDCILLCMFAEARGSTISTLDL